MTKPAFFLVGAPKCGTTSLYHYLGQHPEIFVPVVKEPRFFSTDLPLKRYTTRMDDYLALFQDGWGKVCGDGSTDSLRSQRAAHEIRSFNPNAKIIIMLRNPVDFLYSLHNQNLYQGCEDIADFAQALEAEPDRREGRRIPPDCYYLPNLLYTESAQFAIQVQRYLDTFDRNQIHVIIYDDFKHNTTEIFRDTLAFLGVDPTFVPKFEVRNPSKFVRSRLLRSFIIRQSPATRLLARKLVPASVRHRIVRFNTRHKQRPPMDHALRKRLQAQFAPEVERLSALIGCDLTHWSIA